MAREAELDAWMARLATGDRAAFDLLFPELHLRALRLARARLGDAAAPDVAQAALLRVFARASEFTPGRPCLPWFYAIVANEIRASRRRDARLEAHADPAGNAPSEAPCPETLLMTRELERALALAVESLDDQAEAAIRAMLGLAELPSVPSATFRKRVSRAYARLRVLLEGHHG